jgi:pyrophosphate--fructose-6-phosphate 1-phosphotransferase
MIEFVEERSRPYEIKVPLTKSNRIGVVFCGRQAPGGLNVIGGLLAFCKKNSGTLLGFRNGTKGLFDANYMEINEEYYELYQNQGGFHLLGRSSDSIAAKDFPTV